MKIALIIVAFIFVYLLVGAVMFVPIAWILCKMNCLNEIDVQYDDSLRWYSLALWPLLIAFLILFGIAYFPYWLTVKFSEKIFK